MSINIQAEEAMLLSLGGGKTELKTYSDDLKQALGGAVYVTNKEFESYPEGALINVTFTWNNRIAPTVVEHYEVIVESPEAEVDFATDWTKVGNMYISPTNYTLLSIAQNIVDDGNRVNVMITGPSGTGKTELLYEWGEIHGMEVVHFPCSNVKTPTDWFGRWQIKEDGSTYFEETNFLMALSHGKVLLIFDEWNRTDPSNFNTLLSLLDGRGYLDVFNTRYAAEGGVMIAFTANIGYQYNATYISDAAHVGRMDMMLSTDELLPAKLEVQLLAERWGIDHKEANSVVKTMKKLRDSKLCDNTPIDVTTRKSLSIAKQLKYGADMRMALVATIINQAAQIDPVLWKDIRDNLGVADEQLQ